MLAGKNWYNLLFLFIVIVKQFFILQTLQISHHEDIIILFDTWERVLQDISYNEIRNYINVTSKFNQCASDIYFGINWNN